jgi:hypothetical protein
MSSALSTTEPFGWRITGAAETQNDWANNTKVKAAMKAKGKRATPEGLRYRGKADVPGADLFSIEIKDIVLLWAGLFVTAATATAAAAAATATAAAATAAAATATTAAAATAATAAATPAAAEPRATATAQATRHTAWRQWQRNSTNWAGGFSTADWTIRITQYEGPSTTGTATVGPGKLRHGASRSRVTICTGESATDGRRR